MTTLIITIDNDLIPGAFFTDESVRDGVQRVLEAQLQHYNPKVVLTKDVTQAKALRDALRTADDLGFGADVDADSIIEEGARQYLNIIWAGEGDAAEHYGTTLTIGDTKVTLTREQVNDWDEREIIYPCQPGKSEHGWHLDPETCP